MKNAILIHGTCDKDEYFDGQYPSLSNSHWFPWLQKQLLVKSIHTDTPEMPDAHTPEYDKWKTEFERFDVNKNTSLVGHSCGGGFLLRWLSENPILVDKVILVAPWFDPERDKTTDFFNFQIDREVINRANKFQIFVSNDDEQDILDSVKTIKQKIVDINIRYFEGMGHFTEGEMRRKDFPALLEELLK